MLVKHCMSNALVTVSEDLDYKLAFAKMADHKIHHLPVINQSKEVVGMVTLRDLEVAARCYLESPVEIRDVMHTPVFTARGEDSLQHATQTMIEKQIGCLPVLDGANHLEGILTESDLFQVLNDRLAQEV